jgi:hypothetical protein
LTAELCYWYGVNAFELTRSQQVGLFANLQRCQSQDRLMHGRFDDMDYNGVHDLYMSAFGDARLAREAKVQALKRFTDYEMAINQKGK